MEQSSSMPGNSKASLETLPAEIKLMILKCLKTETEISEDFCRANDSTPDLDYGRASHNHKNSGQHCGRENIKNLALCSKLFYNLCFQERFEGIRLNSDAIKAFQPGGICEYRSGDIRYIRIKAVMDRWQLPKPNDRRREFNLCSAEDAISQLRMALEALRRFPNLEKLCIKYILPPMAQKNTYISILKAITCLGKLKYLELTMDNYKDDTYHPSSLVSRCLIKQSRKSSPQYNYLLSILSPADRKFLGREITEDKIESLVKKNLPKLNLSSLEILKISSNYIADPILHPGLVAFKRAKFYYLSLTAAPQLQKLFLEFTGEGSKYSKADGFMIGLDEQGPALCPQVTDLELITTHLPNAYDCQRLVNIFPNLRRLHLEVSERILQDYEGWVDTNWYRNIIGLKDVTYMTLPWLRDSVGCFEVDELGEICLRLKEDGLSKLESVRFIGDRYGLNIHKIDRYGSYRKELYPIESTVYLYEDRDGWTFRTEGYDYRSIDSPVEDFDDDYYDDDDDDDDSEDDEDEDEDEDKDEDGNGDEDGGNGESDWDD